MEKRLNVLKIYDDHNTVIRNLMKQFKKKYRFRKVEAVDINIQNDSIYIITKDMISYIISSIKIDYIGSEKVNITDIPKDAVIGIIDNNKMKSISDMLKDMVGNNEHITRILDNQIELMDESYNLEISILENRHDEKN